MASILSHSSTGGTRQSDRLFARLVRWQKTLFSRLQERFARKQSSGKIAALRLKGNAYTFLESRKTEEEALGEQRFSSEEITCLLRLREHYQNGGSDRAFITRHLSFLKYLRSRNQLSS